MKEYFKKCYWLIFFAALFDFGAIGFWSQFIKNGYISVDKYRMDFYGESASGILTVFSLGALIMTFYLLLSIYDHIRR